MDRKTTSLAPALAKLLVQLDNGWLPTDFSLPGFATIQINQRPWPGSISGIELDESMLIIRLQVHRKDWQDTDNFHVTAQSDEGGQLDAQHSSISKQYGEPLTITLSCQQWSYTPPVAPVLWVAPLRDVSEVNTPGNLFTLRQQGEANNSSITGVRLASEQFAFYILNTKGSRGSKQALLAFENITDQVLTSETISMELPLLRVVLAKPMRPGVFYGLDAEGQTTAALAAARPQAALPVSNYESLVPLSYYEVQARISWIAPFYRKLHSANAATGGISPVSFSLTRYGHSLAPLDVETQFELVAGAVWILANHLSGADSPASENVQLNTLVSGSDQFSAATRAMNWLGNVYGPDGELVGQEMLAAVQDFLYGTLADYHVADPSQNVVIQRFNRVQRLRRAYAVLLSQAIGYQGRISTFEPITNYSSDRLRGATPSNHKSPGWLSSPEDGTEEATEARQVYEAKADVTGLSVWPTFELPTLPQDELLKAFSTFAEEIRYQTKGKVSARLRPFPRRAGKPLHLSFRLMVDKAPTTQVALFTLELLGKGFEVQGWSDKTTRVTTPKSLEKFQQALLASPEFKYQVERLLLIEEDIRRGEA